MPYYSSYAAAKHGVIGLSDSLRQEVDQAKIKDVHVCRVMPTAHDTPFFDHAANYTGHEVRPPKPLHDPQNVVETIVRLARDPKDKEIVGADGVVKILMKTLAPAVEEKMAAKFIHNIQYEDVPPARNSPGAVAGCTTKQPRKNPAPPRAAALDSFDNCVRRRTHGPIRSLQTVAGIRTARHKTYRLRHSARGGIIPGHLNLIAPLTNHRQESI
jgi:hypothetical protein